MSRIDFIWSMIAPLQDLRRCVYRLFVNDMAWICKMFCTRKIEHSVCYLDGKDNVTLLLIMLKSRLHVVLPN